MLVKDTYFRHLVIREDAGRIVSIQVNVSFRLSIDFFRQISYMCFSCFLMCILLQRTHIPTEALVE